MLQKQTENSSILNFPKSLYIFLNQETNIVTILQILFKFWHYLLIRFSSFPGVGFNPRSHTAFMNFQNTNIWAPVPEILIYLGHGLGIWILKSSRGDSSIHPSLWPLPQGLQTYSWPMEESRGLDDPQSKRKKKPPCPPLHPTGSLLAILFSLQTEDSLGVWPSSPKMTPFSPTPHQLVSGSWLTQLCSGHPSGPGMTAQVWWLGPLTWVSDLMAQLLQLVQLWNREEQGRDQREWDTWARAGHGTFFASTLGESPQRLSSGSLGHQRGWWWLLRVLDLGHRGGLRDCCRTPWDGLFSLSFKAWSSATSPEKQLLSARLSDPHTVLWGERYGLSPEPLC